MNNTVESQKVPISEKLSYALTNTGQTMIYALFTQYLMMYMTDYIGILPSIAGIIIGITRIFDAANDPIMGQILDKTNTRWGKCRPYMLFTPIPLAIITMLMFAPFPLKGNAVIFYAGIVYLIFTMIYTANDIPYWSMSAVITTDPKERVSIVTLTRMIGGVGSGITIGGFWFVVSLFSGKVSNRYSFFFSVIIFSILGAILMLQGFFHTKERAKNTSGSEKLLDNMKLIPKSKPLMLNIVSGIMMSVTAVGMTAMTTYFVKWNIKTIYADMASDKIMSIFSPVIGILPAIAGLIGLLSAPALIKHFEKRDILICSGVFGIIVNIIFYFVGYSNLYLFIIGRFFVFLPFGIWSSVTTLMIGDSVDEIQFRTGKRVEGTCFSLLTFIGKFQNGIAVAITGFILTIVDYDGKLDANLHQQSDKALAGIFIMVTLVQALGMLLSTLPFIFYDFTKKKHKEMLEIIRERELKAESCDA